MTISKFHPPFTNKVITDFFDFKCSNQHKALFIRDWLGDNFPDFETHLKYHIPFYFCESVPILYLHYHEYDGVLDLEVCFLKAELLDDKMHIFEPKNHKTKAIRIVSLDESFLDNLRVYINQALRVNNLSVY